MAVPKKRTSRRVRDQRRAHDFLVASAAVESCPDCGASKQRHHVCPSCGHYDAREVVATTKEVDIDEDAA